MAQPGYSNQTKLVARTDSMTDHSECVQVDQEVDMESNTLPLPKTKGTRRMLSMLLVLVGCLAVGLVGIYLALRFIPAFGLSDALKEIAWPGTFHLGSKPTSHTSHQNNSNANVQDLSQVLPHSPLFHKLKDVCRVPASHELTMRWWTLRIIAIVVVALIITGIILPAYHFAFPEADFDPIDIPCPSEINAKSSEAHIEWSKTDSEEKGSLLYYWIGFGVFSFVVISTLAAIVAFKFNSTFNDQPHQSSDQEDIPPTNLQSITPLNFNTDAVVVTPTEKYYEEILGNLKCGKNLFVSDSMDLLEADYKLLLRKYTEQLSLPIPMSSSDSDFKYIDESGQKQPLKLSSNPEERTLLHACKVLHHNFGCALEDPHVLVPVDLIEFGYLMFGSNKGIYKQQKLSSIHNKDIRNAIDLLKYILNPNTKLDPLEHKGAIDEYLKPGTGSNSNNENDDGNNDNGDNDDNNEIKNENNNGDTSAGGNASVADQQNDRGSPGSTMDVLNNLARDTANAFDNFLSWARN